MTTTTPEPHTPQRVGELLTKIRNHLFDSILLTGEADALLHDTLSAWDYGRYRNGVEWLRSAVRVLDPLLPRPSPSLGSTTTAEDTEPSDPHPPID